MKRFLISVSLLLSFAGAANACMPEDQSDKFYMFCYCNNSFKTDYSEAMDKFWQDYCDTKYYVSDDDRMKAASRKNDREMQVYLQQLKKYDDSDNYADWDYPTALELAQTKQTLRDIINVAKANLNGKYGSHWALLVMRANMRLNNHQDNIAFYTANAKKYKKDCYTEMMRNIYARDLLQIGKKEQAWNIYAEQNDQQSLLWSVRKYTNLAGIKTLCAENPNAPVLNFLIQTYVNRIQSLIEERETDCPYLDYRNVIWGKAYAQVPANQAQEFSGFVAFAKQMANGGKTKVPCMWMSAAALVSYYLDDCNQAKQCIDQAMTMKGTQAMKDNARRIRMLIEPTVANLKSSEFKAFIARELRWLDSQVTSDDAYGDVASARERIVKWTLAEEYKRCNERNLYVGLNAVADFVDTDRNDYYADRFNYSSKSFGEINKMTAKEIEQYFNMLDSNTDDPLVSYLSEKLSKRYSANLRNDLIGTKLIAENKLAEALPYLQKVDMKYLEGQAIAYYAYHRDYKTPFWEGYQSIDASEYDDEGNLVRFPLKSNVKVDFCKDVIALQNKLGAVDVATRKQISYQLATYYFQASYKGQCWFITHYGQSVYEEQNPREANFPEIARNYLTDAATSADSRLKTEALFGLVGTSPDEWATEKYDSRENKFFNEINYGSLQYSSLVKLDNIMKSTHAAPEYISNCDVIQMFRTHRENEML